MSRLGKKQKTVFITFFALLLMLATIPLGIWVTHTATAMTGNTKARCESVAQPVHTVIVKNGIVSPAHTVAKQCDTLTIINEDDRIRLMAFGPHDNHISYDGISERALGPGQSLTVKLIRVGTFPFHDHEDSNVAGAFTVSD